MFAQKVSSDIPLVVGDRKQFEKQIKQEGKLIKPWQIVGS
jgi:hypothetical protein